MNQDYYELLKVSPDASINDIKKQYRKLAAQYHPDRTTEESHRAHFLKLTEAYEVLGNENKKDLYDQTYGTGNFKNYISSKTVTLTSQNYERLVVNSGQTWVIQVFDHDSYLSQTFADTWEKLADRYFFLKFGRIDRRAQQKLLHKLPFRPLEFPFLFVQPSEGAPDFVDYSPGDDIAKKLIQTVKDTIHMKVRIIGPNELGEWLENPNTVAKPRVVYLNRAGFDDILFLHESPLLSSVEFLSTRTDLFGIVQYYLQNTHNVTAPKYILIHPHGSAAAQKWGQIEYITGGYHTFAKKLHLAYPPEIKQATAYHLCKDKTCIIANKVLSEIAGKKSVDNLELNCRLMTISENSPSELRQYFSHITAGRHQDMAMAFDYETGKVAPVDDVKQTLLKDDFEGLCELAREEIKLEGRYVSDYYLNCDRLEDLLSENTLASYVSKVSPRFSVRQPFRNFSQY